MVRWLKDNWGALILAALLIAATANIIMLPRKDLPKGVSHGESTTNRP